MKKLMPYIVTVAVFCIIFILTQLIETRQLYLGLYAESGSVVNNHKTALQVKIFLFGLTLWLTSMNFLPAVKSWVPSLRNRVLMSVLTIIIIYVINYFIAKAVDSGGFNIYYDWRKNRGIPLSIITIILTTGLTWTLYQIGKFKIAGSIK